MIFFFGVFIASTYLESFKLLNYVMVLHIREVLKNISSVESQMKFKEKALEIS